MRPQHVLISCCTTHGSRSDSPACFAPSTIQDLNLDIRLAEVAESTITSLLDAITKKPDLSPRMYSSSAHSKQPSLGPMSLRSFAKVFSLRNTFFSQSRRASRRMIWEDDTLRARLRGTRRQQRRPWPASSMAAEKVSELPTEVPQLCEEAV